MKQDGPLMKLSFDFALDIVRMYECLVSDKKEWVMSRQLLRSGTSIGAMVRESRYAESTKDFIHKLSVALKEANESNYWLELLYRSGYIEKERFGSLSGRCTELLKILTSILITTKQNLLSKQSINRSQPQTPNQ
jgi:four helix bundle protein